MSNTQREVYREAFYNNCLIFDREKISTINKKVMFTITPNKTNYSLSVFQKNMMKINSKLNRLIYGRKFHREGINKITFFTFFEKSNGIKELPHCHLFVCTPSHKMIPTNEWCELHKVTIFLNKLCKQFDYDFVISNNKISKDKNTTINYASKQYHPHYNDNFQIY